MSTHSHHHRTQHVTELALAALAAAVVALLPLGAAAGPCPKVSIKVDNDLSGSGYSEVNAKNWVSLPHGSCHKNYRYLSHTVGDGSRKGKAIWKPKITHAGWYSVQASYRATTNRTPDADYYLYSDVGATKKVVVNQKHSGDCTKKILGSIYCKVGGSCRLVLDGTDDSQSDSADLTTFTLVSCTKTSPDAGPPADSGAPKGPCAPIAANKSFELCKQTATTCAGVFKNGSGCKAFCAAAGMVCAGRFGGEPGCQKEPATTIGCGASNGHLSDWCECALAVKPDAGQPDLFQTPDVLGAPDAGGAPPDMSPGPPEDSAGAVDGYASPDSATNRDGSAVEPGADGGATSPPPDSPLIAGCGCGVGTEGLPGAVDAWPLLLGLVLLGVGRRRRQ